MNIRVIHDTLLWDCLKVSCPNVFCLPCLKDLPDVQELITEVNAEKYSLQAAAILGGYLTCKGSHFVFIG